MSTAERAGFNEPPTITERIPGRDGTTVCPKRSAPRALAIIPSTWSGISRCGTCQEAGRVGKMGMDC